jgi:4-amino-4-deoxy-L-arabinose transferase-like glycosyltransferase
MVLRAAWLLLGTTALLLPGLGRMPFERAEIYFADGARAMVERGDWLVPYYRGEPFFDKPALTYWLIAAAFELFGFSPGAARLVPAAATLATLVVTLLLGAQLVGRRAALAGGLALATTLAFVGFGRVAMSDMLLALTTNAALALGVAAWRPAAARWAALALGAVLGLGFLTKGPVAVLLPGLGLLLLAWRRRHAPWPFTPARIASAAALFALFGCAWWLAVWARLGSWPLEYFFLHENLERFAGATYDSGREPWFYLTTYLVQGAPWSLFLPLAVWGVLRRRPAGDEPPASLDGVRLLLGWLALMAVPLSLSRGKIDYYLLPFYPAAALVVGHLLTEGRWGRLERLWTRAGLLLLGVALAFAARFPARIPQAWLPPSAWLVALGVGVGLALVALAVVAVRPTPWRVRAVLAAVAAGLFLALVGVLLPPFRAAQPNDAILADVTRERRYEPDLRVAYCEDPVRVQRDILFELRLAADERCDLWAAVAARTPYLLVLDESEWSLGRAQGMRHVATYRYLPASVLNARRLLRGVHPGRLALYANFETRDPVAVLKARREWRRYVQQLERAQAGDETPRPRKHKRRRQRP